MSANTERWAMLKLFPRSRLTARLRTSRFAAIHALAGFGKTLVLREVVRGLATWWPSVTEPLPQLKPPACTDFVVIDEAHRYPSAELARSVELMLSSRQRVLIATRHPLAPIHSCVERVDVSADDLVFTVEDVQMLLTTVQKRDVSEREAREVWEQTGGWPMLIDRGQSATRSGDINVDSTQYTHWAREVLASLPPRAREAAAQLAFLHSVDPQLSCALGHVHVLNDICHALRLRRDIQFDIHRVPGLIQKLLLRHVTETGQRTSLRRSVITAYLTIDRFQEALRLATDEADWEASAQLLMEQGSERIQAGHLACVARGLHRLPPYLVEREPLLQLLAAQIDELQGRVTEATVCYARLAESAISVVSAGARMGLDNCERRHAHRHTHAQRDNGPYALTNEAIVNLIGGHHTEMAYRRLYDIWAQRNKPMNPEVAALVTKGFGFFGNLRNGELSTGAEILGGWIAKCPPGRHTNLQRKGAENTRSIDHRHSEEIGQCSNQIQISFGCE